MPAPKRAIYLALPEFHMHQNDEGGIRQPANDGEYRGPERRAESSRYAIQFEAGERRMSLIENRLDVFEANLKQNTDMTAGLRLTAESTATKVDEAIKSIAQVIENTSPLVSIAADIKTGGRFFVAISKFFARMGEIFRKNWLLISVLFLATYWAIYRRLPEWLPLLFKALF
jgi:hypothetical protein